MKTDNMNSVDSRAESATDFETGESSGSVDEFALTKLLRIINGKLKDGIAGIVQRTYGVLKAILGFVKDMVVHLVVDGFPWLFRLLWNVVKFIFGRKMFNLVKENIILIILFPIFILALAWPGAVYYYVGNACWLWIGWAWLMFIGLAGAWIGFKKGLYSKWLSTLKARRASKKSRSATSIGVEKGADKD